MKSVAALVTPDLIKQLAIPSNVRYGTAIYERGAVEIIGRSPARVEAWAGGLSGSVAEGGGSRRRVELTATETGLVWHCSGNPKDHQVFCKHCVAVGLAIIRHPS